MEKQKALEVIEDELGSKAKDKRTKAHKAMKALKMAVITPEDIDRIIEETFAEMKVKHEKDY